MLPAGETSTTGMFPVFADTTVTGRNVAAVLAGVGEPRRHLAEGEASAIIAREMQGVRSGVTRWTNRF